MMRAHVKMIKSSVVIVTAFPVTDTVVEVLIARMDVIKNLIPEFAQMNIKMDAYQLADVIRFLIVVTHLMKPVAGILLTFKPLLL